MATATTHIVPCPQMLTNLDNPEVLKPLRGNKESVLEIGVRFSGLGVKELRTVHRGKNSLKSSCFSELSQDLRAISLQPLFPIPQPLPSFQLSYP